ncbi:GyrI-like domain-containing protein [Planococcus ruber]|uniref:GyrI-like domain-containing protein n=1 Tax=Planococcus ruber TaxID=2027871 RepID=UPI001FED5C8C|nr:GyrI-like domain-containing protein [Planococcus ruber]MCJ1908400.1 GyrI-like domain-containing protein [Planococcus ruber]
MASYLLSGPTVEYRVEQPYAAIPIQAALEEWNKTTALVPELFQWLENKNALPAGAPFYRYWCLGDGKSEFDLEVGVPLESMVAGDERVIASSIPEGSYVCAIHRGHPDTLADSVHEVEKWAEKEGLSFDKRFEGNIEIWNGRFEQYLTDPETEPDLTKWEIELSFLILRDEIA